jgi:hypothetical protein
MRYNDNLERPHISMNDPFFKYKFQREPRVWSLEEVQDLYDKLLERNKPFIEKSRKIVNRIMKEVDIDSNTESSRTLYYYDDDEIYTITFKKDLNWGYSYTHNGKLDLKTREKTLDFLIDFDKKLELGNLFIENKRLISNLPNRVKEILHNMMNKKLLEYYEDFKDNKFLINNLVVSVGNRKYIATNRSQGNYHLDFKFEHYMEVSL